MTFCGTIQEGRTSASGQRKNHQDRSGTLCLTGANTYSGGTTVSAGILEGTPMGYKEIFAITPVVSLLFKMRMDPIAVV